MNKFTFKVFGIVSIAFLIVSCSNPLSSSEKIHVENNDDVDGVTGYYLNKSLGNKKITYQWKETGGWVFVVYLPDSIESINIAEADPDTFRALSQFYGVDKNNIYYFNRHENKYRYETSPADSATIEIIDYAYAKDKNALYFKGRKAKEQ